jgi:hypothetical protein
MQKGIIWGFLLICSATLVQAQSVELQAYPAGGIGMEVNVSTKGQELGSGTIGLIGLRISNPFK